MSRKFHVNMIKCALQTNTIQINHNKLRIPTGRLTSWLFTRRGGAEFGATEDKSIQWQGEGFEPGTSGLQVQRPTTRPRSPPYIYNMNRDCEIEIPETLMPTILKKAQQPVRQTYEERTIDDQNEKEDRNAPIVSNQI